MRLDEDGWWHDDDMQAWRHPRGDFLPDEDVVKQGGRRQLLEAQAKFFSSVVNIPYPKDTNHGDA